MILVFDIGGSKMRFALSDDKQTLSNIRIVETGKDFAESLLTIKEIEKEYNKRIDLVVGGLPGPLDQNKEMLLKAPNLKDWAMQPVKQLFSDIFHCPVYLENDAALAGLGEATFGEGKLSEILAYINIGSGVGGARIVHKELDKNIIGFEPGHQIINNETLESLEDLVSGRGIERKLGIRATDIRSEQVLDEIHKNVAIGLNNILVTWTPDTIILGGGLINLEVLSIEKIQKELRNILKIYPEIPKIYRARLGDKAGLFGALALANKVQ